MSAQRLKLLYPYNIFRAKINYKNVRQGKPWAVGQLYTDGSTYFLIDISEGEENYKRIDIKYDTLSLKTFFKDSNDKDIFEGDQLSISSDDGNTEIKGPVYIFNGAACVAERYIYEFFDDEMKPKEGYTVKITGNIF